MDRTDDLWTAIRRVLPDTEDLAMAVAAEIDEPLDDVRSSVHIGAIAINGQLGPEAVAIAAIETELARLKPTTGRRPSDRLFAADSLDELLAETQALEAAGSLDLETIVAIQRASGAIAARTDRRMVVLMHRYDVTRRLIWEHCVAAMEAGRLAPDLLGAFGRFLLLWNELTALAVTDGYRTAERDILARAVEARRGALQELLGVVAEDTLSEAHRRRVAIRHGLDPDRAYRLIAIAPRPESDPIPERPGIGEEELEVLAGRIGHLLGSTAPGAEGVGAGIRLPAVLPLMRRIAVLARDDWAGLAPRAGGARYGPRRAREGGPVQGPRTEGGPARGRGGGMGGGRLTHRSKASNPWLRPTPISSTRRASRRGSGCVAGSRIPSSSPSSACSWPIGTSPTRPSGASSARCSPTTGSARSSSRRSRPISMPVRTSPGPPGASTWRPGRSPTGSRRSRTSSVIRSTARRAGACRSRSWCTACAPSTDDAQAVGNRAAARHPAGTEPP